MKTWVNWRNRAVSFYRGFSILPPLFVLLGLTSGWQVGLMSARSPFAVGVVAFVMVLMFAFMMGSAALRLKHERLLARSAAYDAGPSIEALLSAIDSLDRAVVAAEPLLRAAEQGVEDDAAVSLALGLRMIGELFDVGLRSLQIEPLSFPLGTPFNPAYHDAVALLPAPGLPANTIARVLHRGYWNLVTGRLLRPAMVCVTPKTEGAT